MDTIAYCLMPTHFHFLIFIPSSGGLYLKNSDYLECLIGNWLSSYTKAINKRFTRNGCLFQRHTKAIPVSDDKYLITLLSYIHQNPVRSGITRHLENWEFSSYRDYAGFRYGGFVKKEAVEERFSNAKDFRLFSEELIVEIEKKFWV